jgi:hypothetical protein
MLRNRRWAAVGALALAQIVIIVCYVGILRGNSAPAARAQEKCCAPTKDAAPDRDGNGTDGTAGPCPAVAGTAVPSEPVMLAQAPSLPQPGVSVTPPGLGEVGPPPPPGPNVERAGAPAPILSELAQAPAGDAKKDEPGTKAPTPPTTSPDNPAVADQVSPPPLPAAPPPSPGASLLKPTDPPAPTTPAPPSPAPVIDKPDAIPTPPATAMDKKEATPAPAAPIAPPPLPAEKPVAIPAPPAVPGTVSGPTTVSAETGSAPVPTPPSGEGRLVPMTAGTAPAPAPEEPAAPVACPWSLRMEIVKGRTQLEARIGKEVQFRVTCSQLSIEAPRGCLNAKGEVKITGSDLDGSCEGLTINWQDDHVFLEGKAHLKCLRNGQDVELNSERLSVKLSTSSSVKGVGSRKRVQTEEPPTEADDTDLK